MIVLEKSSYIQNSAVCYMASPGRRGWGWGGSGSKPAFCGGWIKGRGKIGHLGKKTSPRGGEPRGEKWGGMYEDRRIGEYKAEVHF